MTKENYDIWLENLRKEKGQTVVVPKGTISKIPPGYNTVQRTFFQYTKENEFVKKEVYHNTGDIYSEVEGTTWKDFAQKAFNDMLTPFERDILLRSHSVKFAPSHIGTVLICYDENKEILGDFSG